MKKIRIVFLGALLSAFSCSPKIEKSTSSRTGSTNVKVSSQNPKKSLFLDVHNLGAGNVTLEAVAGAHQKDLATQGKYGVNFTNYWVDVEAGKVYCLVEAPDSASVSRSHKEAHGLVPDLVHKVSEGEQANFSINRPLYLDVHLVGPGKITAADVAGAHAKDLAVQGRHNVNFINYWVDEKAGVIMCLAEAKDEQSLIDTHKEAHGLVPNEIRKVTQGK